MDPKKEVLERYNNTGVSIYNLAKTGKSIEDIAKESEINELKVCEIVNYLWDRKFISRWNSKSGIDERIKEIADRENPIKNGPEIDVSINFLGGVVPQFKFETIANELREKTLKRELKSWHIKKLADCYYVSNLKVIFNQFSYAEAFYQQAIKLSNSEEIKPASLHNNLGAVYYQKRDYENAIKEFDQALQIDPKYWKALYNKGKVYSISKDYERAIDSFTNAIKVAQNIAKTYLSRGDIYYELKFYDKTKQDYEKALQLDPQNKVTINSLRNLTGAEEPKECEPLAPELEYKPYIENNRRLDGFPYTNRANTLYHGRNYLAAGKYYEKALEIEKLPLIEIMITYGKAASAYSRAGKYEKAMELFRKIFGNLYICRKFGDDLLDCIRSGTIEGDEELLKVLEQIDKPYEISFNRKGTVYDCLKDLINLDSEKIDEIKERITNNLSKVELFDQDNLYHFIIEYRDKGRLPKEQFQEILLFILDELEELFPSRSFLLNCLKADVLIANEQYDGARIYLEKAREIVKPNKFLEMYLDYRYTLIEARRNNFSNLVYMMKNFKERYKRHPPYENYWFDNNRDVYPLHLDTFKIYSGSHERYVIQILSYYLSCEYAEAETLLEFAPIYELKQNIDFLNLCGLIKYYVKDYRISVDYFSKALEIEKRSDIYFNRAAAYHGLCDEEKSKLDLSSIQDLKNPEEINLEMIFTDLDALDRISKNSLIFLNDFIYFNRTLFEKTDGSSTNLENGVNGLADSSEFSKCFKILEAASILKVADESKTDKLMLNIVNNLEKELELEFTALSQDLLEKQLKEFGFTTVLNYSKIFHNLKSVGITNPTVKRLGKLSGSEEARYLVPKCRFDIKFTSEGGIKAEIKKLSGLLKDANEGQKNNSYAQLAELYYLIENYEKAVEIYENLINNKKSEDIYLKLGTCYFQLAKYESSLHYFNKCLELNKENSDALFNKAISYFALEDYEKSIGIFDDYLKNNRDHISYYLKGRAYYNMEKFDFAEPEYKKCLEVNPNFYEAELDLERISFKTEPVVGEGKGQKELVNTSELVNESEYGFSNIAGMKKLKDIIALKILYPLKHPEKAKEYCKTFGGGLLLYGPPGCGKSYVVEAIAGEAGLKLIRVNIADILNMYVGNSEKNLALVFEEARRNQPSIIFFDEVEALGGRREDLEQRWQRTVVNQFLLEMDKIGKNNEQILIIGATNAPWDVDHALRRSGRFNHILFVEPPDLETRVDLFKMYTCRIKLIGDLDYLELARVTDGFSCANIKAICEKATDIAWKESVEKDTSRKVVMEDFVKVIKDEKCDVNEWFEIAKGFSANPLLRENYKELVNYIKRYKTDKENTAMFG